MKKITIFLSFTILVLASCNEWLNVKPKGQVEADDLLSDQRGYNSALAGVYQTLAGSPLYSCELSYGMMDLLAQYWDISSESSHTYQGIDKYDYTGSKAMSAISRFWNDLYMAISQCNLILEGLEKNGGSIEYSELMEAEALGLRAFCHMELFRLFGPIVREAADLDKKAIAYRADFDVEALEFESCRSILEKVKADLLEALELAKEDPIRNLGRKGDGNVSSLNYNGVIAYRGNRMNWFAIAGMLARTEQYLHDQDGAYEYSKMILDSLDKRGTFKLITTLDLNSQKKDYNYSAEMLFGLHCEKLYESTSKIFGMGNNKYESKSGFRISHNRYILYQELYGEEGSGYDNRLKYWFESQPGSVDNYDLTKLREPSVGFGAAGAGAYEPEIPILRLSEIYYIACESRIGKDNELAVSYLNAVRTARNINELPKDLTDAQLLRSLLLDMRKEFIGEGRMFPTYKRLFHPIQVTPSFAIQPHEAMFVFPIPDDEYEYSPNQKPNV